ncbi:AAA family ATPase [Occultella gossypii]|uniref:AAA family ATPase n=1 Tax=Occultella gossypii TaxID=2800820 RepID=A0ABS7S9P7_9MICO|nr:AAA family ATPase [Occultella gossypii]MBZ2197071.1 AAA family ATPase [Occultella gossypii]
MSAVRVHLLYGLAGSGKSTLARALAADGRAVRFTLDEWMLRLYPDISASVPRALARARSGQSYAHPVTAAGNEHLAALMEEPSPDEGVQIVEL